MNDMPLDNKWIGQRTIRPDGIEKVTGSAQYAADFTMPGMVWGMVLRRPPAHALRKKLEHKNEMLAETVTVLRRELGAQWLNYTLDDHRWGCTNVQRRNYMVQ